MGSEGNFNFENIYHKLNSSDMKWRKVVENSSYVLQIRGSKNLKKQWVQRLIKNFEMLKGFICLLNKN